MSIMDTTEHSLRENDGIKACQQFSPFLWPSKRLLLYHNWPPLIKVTKWLQQMHILPTPSCFFKNRL